jgi:hypothetical protein
MAHLVHLPQHACERGTLTVFEKLLPGSLKRVFFITQTNERTRGGLQHPKAWQALVCLHGRVGVLAGKSERTRCYSLTKPDLAD